jgi:hypothetical protein
MPEIPKRLSVMIPVRDRIHLTTKCIESIWKNSGDTFKSINIYVFDNKSDLNEDNRLSIFQQLLKEKKITYYSYDTHQSSCKCFGKAITFQRWVDMMKNEHNLLTIMNDSLMTRTENYYLLLDNDFIVGKNWGQYFVSAIRKLKYIKDIHYLVPFPGGIPDRFRGADKPEYDFPNMYDETDKFTVKMANGGGSSGFWFMSYDMLQKMRWDNETMTKTWERDKRHDTESWNMIRRKNGDINYVGAVGGGNYSPYALHLGGVTGSVCNQLTKNTYTENALMIKKAEVDLIKECSVDELWKKYKDDKCRW